jgi:hypothetical protein
LAEHRHDHYVKRMHELQKSINALNLAENIATPEEMFDPYCDPKNPVKVHFNNVSAAAYRLKGGTGKIYNFVFYLRAITIFF